MCIRDRVYAAGSTAASAQLDSHEEQALGAFDAVSRATVNHGLHRGSFQSTACLLYTSPGNDKIVDAPARVLFPRVEAVAPPAVLHLVRVHHPEAVRKACRQQLDVYKRQSYRHFSRQKRPRFVSLPQTAR